MNADISGDEYRSLKKIVNINEIIHTPVRLAILIFLLSRQQATFADIQKALNLTAGNLSSHIKKLEAAHFITVEKIFINSKPTTLIYITSKGRTGIAEYANILRHALDNIS